MLRLSVKFKRILMLFAVKRHQRDSIHFVQNFLDDSMHIFNMAKRFRKVYILFRDWHALSSDFDFWSSSNAF